MNEKTAGVIIPADMHKPPEAHEIKAAWILAHYFDAVVEFIKPADTYQTKTPDFMLDGQAWELKSPRGKSSAVIQKSLGRAMRQSKFIVIDASRFPYSDSVIENRIRHELKLKAWPQIKSLLLITKKGEVIEMLE